MAGTLAARIATAPRPHDRDHAAEIAALFADLPSRLRATCWPAPPGSAAISAG
jgi:hypothetical protein